MNKIIPLFSIIIIALCLYYISFQKDLTTIQFFPIDDSLHFTEADTKIQHNTKQPANEFVYITYSNSSEKTYLRQDISFLYGNGLFIGMLQHWKQNTDVISLHQDFSIPMSAYLQAISFHHAEIHPKDTEKIYSIQQMSTDSLYIIKNGVEVSSFKEPTTATELKFSNQITPEIDQRLLDHWQKLEQFFVVNSEDYTRIPFTSIDPLLSEGLSLKTSTIKEQIIGQLWEGIYREYGLLLSEQRQPLAHYMPLILLAKDQSHLLFLFEINQEKYKLLQEFPLNKNISEK